MAINPDLIAMTLENSIEPRNHVVAGIYHALMNARKADDEKDFIASANHLLGWIERHILAKENGQFVYINADTPTGFFDPETKETTPLR